MHTFKWYFEKSIKRYNMKKMGLVIK